MTKKRSKIFGCWLVGLLGVGIPLCGAFAQADAEKALEDELKYIELLQQMRMPDIANEVIAETKARFPEAAAKLRVSELKGLLSQGRFDDVQKEIDAIPDKNGVEFWALTLAKADAYYAFQRYDEADKLYLGFFKKVEKPAGALVTFYRDAAYRYVQMLLYLGRDKEALVAFRNLFKVPLEGCRAAGTRRHGELMLKLRLMSRRRRRRTR